MLDTEGIILELLEGGKSQGISSLVKKCKKKGIPEEDARKTINQFIEDQVLELDRDLKVYIP